MFICAKKPGFSAGIALPMWLVEKSNSGLVLLVYAVAFGIGLPMWVASWWKASRNLTKDKIMHNTMAFFYKELKETMALKQVLEILSVAQEFSHVQTVELPKDFAEKVSSAYQDKISASERLDKSKKYPSVQWGYATRVLLYAHLFRIEVPIELINEYESVIEKSVHLLSAMLQISMSHNWVLFSTFPGFTLDANDYSLD